MGIACISFIFDGLLPELFDVPILEKFVILFAVELVTLIEFLHSFGK